jgi:predicted patatin/cPLA2 family phospholipase
VIETENYAFDQKEILETQENMDALMQRAQKDHLKYVKIPEKYSADLLERARASCKQDQAAGD